MHYNYAILGAALLGCVGNGQTLIDLRTQTKSVDFSAANTTKPFKSGTVLPAACSVGEAYFKTDAPAGSNLYACTSLNSWTVQAGGVTLAGDANGPANANAVTRIQGRSVASNAPVDGQTLVWNGATNRWEPQTTSGGGPAAAPGASFTLAGQSLTVGFPSGGSSFRCGNRITTLTSSGVVTLGPGSVPGPSQAWIYFDCGSSGLKLDTSPNINQSQITVSGIGKGGAAATGFPTDVIPLAALTAGGAIRDQWDGAVTDWHAFQSSNVAKTGSFFSRTGNPDGSVTIALDTTKLSNAAGSTLATVGTIGSAGGPACWDGSGSVTSTGCGNTLYGPAAWYYQQYFCPDSANGAGGYGSQRWPFINGGAAIGYAPATDFSHQCGVQIAANAGGAGNNGLLLGDQTGGGVALFNGLNSVPAGGSLQFYYRFKISSISQVQLILRLSSSGQDQNVNSAVDSAGFFLDSNQGSNPGNLRFQTCSNGSCANTDTGAPIIPGQYYTVMAGTSSSGTWSWSIQASGVNLSGTQSANAPSGALRPGISIKTLDATSKTATVNRFEALASGTSVF